MFSDPYHTPLISDLSSIGIFFIISMILSIVVVVASMLVINQYGDSEKVSTYECGFDPFDDSRSKFDIRFYLVSILFIVFDLEVSFLFPWTIYLSSQTYLSVISMIIFLSVLTVGFVYEWKKDALDWE
jgi:NADH-quinone oxidoreductase subunit A